MPSSSERVEELRGTLSMIGANVILDSEAGSLRRIIWFCLVIVGLIVATYVVQDRVSYYVSDPMTVNIKVERPEVQTYPSVTVCSNRLIGKKWVASDLSTMYLADIIFQAGVLSHCYKLEMSQTQFDSCTKLANISTNSKIIADGTFANYLNDLFMYMSNITVKKCVFIDAACTTDQVQSIVNFQGGCFHFNGTRAVVNNAGRAYSLVLSAALDPAEYLTGIQLRNADFNVYVHEPQLLGYNDASVGITAGQATTITVRKHRTVLMAGGGSCVADGQLQYETTVPYSRKSCLVECLTDFQNATCGCVQGNQPHSDSHKICDTLVDGACGIGSVALFANTKADLTCSCPDECDQIKYELSMVSVPLAPDKSNVSEVEVVLESMDYHVVEQAAAYTVWGMLADIGGALGLFLGSAIYTFVQLVDFILCWTFANTNNEKRNRPTFNSDVVDMKGKFADLKK